MTSNAGSDAKGEVALREGETSAPAAGGTGAAPAHGRCKVKESRAGDGDPPDLRERAEQPARGEPGPAPQDVDALSPEAMRHALHELRARQAELET